LNFNLNDLAAGSVVSSSVLPASSGGGANCRIAAGIAGFFHRLTNTYLQGVEPSWFLRWFSTLNECAREERLLPR
jgi:hypothetical protein